MTTIDAFLAPVVTEVLLTALTRLRSEGPPAVLRVGSPWLTDVPLFPGIFTGSFPFLLPGIGATEVASIGHFIRTWIRNGGSASILVHCYDAAAERHSQHALVPSESTAFAYRFSDELAKVAHDPDQARMLAKRAGFPPEHLPDFKTASIFWSSIIEQALAGMMNVDMLVKEIATQFPYNSKLTDFGGRFAEARASADPLRTAINWPKKVARSNELELELLGGCLDSGAEVLFARGFQDKFVVVPDVVISGSAPMTYSGFYLNRERLSLHNRSSAPHDYETARTACDNHIVTARLAGPCNPPHNLVGVAHAGSFSEIRRHCGVF